MIRPTCPKEGKETGENRQEWETLAPPWQGAVAGEGSLCASHMSLL